MSKSVWPKVEIIGVEAGGCRRMTRFAGRRKRVCLEAGPGLFADGVAVREVGVQHLELASATFGRHGDA